MRDRVVLICLNRLGHKVGSLTVKTDETTKIDAMELFLNNKKVIKSMYPSTVKVKISK